MSIPLYNLTQPATLEKGWLEISGLVLQVNTQSVDVNITITFGLHRKFLIKVSLYLSEMQDIGTIFLL